MKTISKFLAVAILASVATLGFGASVAKANGPRNHRHVHHAGCGHHHQGQSATYGATGYGYAPNPNRGNPFPQSQVYGNVYGLGGTGYRPFGQVYSGMGSGAGWGYGMPSNPRYPY